MALKCNNYSNVLELLCSRSQLQNPGAERERANQNLIAQWSELGAGRSRFGCNILINDYKHKSMKKAHI